MPKLSQDSKQELQDILAQVRAEADKLKDKENAIEHIRLAKTFFNLCYEDAETGALEYFNEQIDLLIEKIKGLN